MTDEDGWDSDAWQVEQARKQAECVAWGHIPFATQLWTDEGEVEDEHYVHDGYLLSVTTSYTLGLLRGTPQPDREPKQTGCEVQWKLEAGSKSPAWVGMECERCGATLFERNIRVPDHVSARDCQRHFEHHRMSGQPGHHYYGFWTAPQEAIDKAQKAWERKMRTMKLDHVNMSLAEASAEAAV